MSSSVALVKMHMYINSCFFSIEYLGSLATSLIRGCGVRIQESWRLGRETQPPFVRTRAYDSPFGEGSGRNFQRGKCISIRVDARMAFLSYSSYSSRLERGDLDTVFSGSHGRFFFWWLG